MRSHIRPYLFALAIVIVALISAQLLDTYELVVYSGYVALAVGALGLAFVWGTLGILSLGHTAFFGLGAYAYAICAMSHGGSLASIFLAVAVATVMAVLLGYFLFFSKLGDVYLAVITLCFTLILYTFFSSTADPYYQLNGVLLGGFNGINAVPGLNYPGQTETLLTEGASFVACAVVLAIVYSLIVGLQSHRIGRAMVGVRENELRSELLGYDVRLYKLGGYAISAAIAGLSGALYTAMTGFAGPNAFDLPQASQFVLWVIAGGVGTLAGPVVASLCLQFLGSFLGTTEYLNVELVFGAVILAFVLLVPQGLQPWLQKNSLLQRLNPFGIGEKK